MLFRFKVNFSERDFKSDKRKQNDPTSEVEAVNIHILELRSDVRNLRNAVLQ